MPKVVESDSGRVVSQHKYNKAGSEAAKKHAASDPNLVVEKKPKVYAARGGLLTGNGSTTGTVRGAGAAERGTSYRKGCASRPRR